jgi:hypothetical protein
MIMLAGCASGGLPYPHWAEVGRQWGCDPLAVQAANREYWSTLPKGTEEVEPQVGWDACELLAKSGEPREVTSIQTPAGRSYTLIYRPVRGGTSHLVTLVPTDAGRWQVETVVW